MVLCADADDVNEGVRAALGSPWEIDDGTAVLKETDVLLNLCGSLHRRQNKKTFSRAIQKKENQSSCLAIIIPFAKAPNDAQNRMTAFVSKINVGDMKVAKIYISASVANSSVTSTITA